MPSPQSIKKRSLPAPTSTAGRPRSADGVLAAVPRKVRSNIVWLTQQGPDSTSPKSGRRDRFVSTRLARESEPELVSSDAVLVQIRDTGTGVAEEHVPHLFEPFFSTKGLGKGTGLGLWVSFGIVQSHGGTIKVRSRLGRGTTFSITLPIGGPPRDGER